MTDLITEARELCEKATPGPWGYDGMHNEIHAPHGDEYFLIMSELREHPGEKILDEYGHSYNANFALIARSRTLIPELCDALEKAQEQMPRWIPVTERLPTGCGYYLSVVERIAPDELGGNNTRVKIMRWLGEDWRYPLHIPEWINEAITETVTHWQPLPAPPEKGAEHE